MSERQDKNDRTVSWTIEVNWKTVAAFVAISALLELVERWMGCS